MSFKFGRNRVTPTGPHDQPRTTPSLSRPERGVMLKRPDVVRQKERPRGWTTLRGVGLWTAGWLRVGQRIGQESSVRLGVFLWRSCF